MLHVRTLRLSVLTTALAALACAADVTGPPAPALAPTAFGLAADGGVITPDPPAPADSDGDGVLDDSDNCLFIPNPDQADADGDGIGDACAGDVDGDGVGDADDNCPETPNPDQADADGDGIGDACAGEPGGGDDGCVVPDPATGETYPGACPDEDGDLDDDGVLDGVDNCPFTPNPDQADADGDGVGDACAGEPGGGGGDDGCVPDPATGETDPGACPDEDGDLDDDGVADGVDNCPFTPNPDQADADGDGVGDACAGEPGGGGDGCVVPDPATGETDPGACPEDDGDLDGDGVPDGTDNCTWMENPGQEDADGDGTGDVCDVLTPDPGQGDGQDGSPAENADRDIDDKPDATDNCPSLPNRFQIDRDGDGTGDACDPSTPLGRLVGRLTDFFSRFSRPGG